MRTILNPTRYPIVAKFDGANYKFLSGEKKEIHNSFAALHIVRRWGKYGLVDITFDDKVAKKFMSPAIYEHSKRLEGTTALLQSLLEKNQNFLSFDEECGQKKTVQRLRFGQIQKSVLRQIKDIETDLAALGDISEASLIDKEIKALNEQAKVLQERAKNLSGNHTPKSTGSSADRTARS